jgi:hypothetical protein
MMVLLQRGASSSRSKVVLPRGSTLGLMRSADESLQRRLERLAAFRAAFRNTDSRIGQHTEAVESEPGHLTMPYWSYTENVEAFIELAYEDGWVRSDVNWGEWMGTDEAAALRDDPSAIERATPDQLAKLLTVVIRQERFVEGAIASAFEAGLIERILERAATLAGVA